MNDKQSTENLEIHRARHQMLHSFLEELYADFISQRSLFENGKPKLLSDVTINELIRWSHEQTRNPTLPTGYKHDTATETG